MHGVLRSPVFWGMALSVVALSIFWRMGAGNWTLLGLTPMLIPVFAAMVQSGSIAPGTGQPPVLTEEEREIWQARAAFWKKVEILLTVVAVFIFLVLILAYTFQTK